LAMLGQYTSFPENPHRLAYFAASISVKRLQQALMETFHKLNEETFRLEDVAPPSIPRCKLVFEFGVAEGNDFSYVDAEEKDRVLKALSRRLFQVLDFLCAIRYYKIEEAKLAPLRFDYYLLRFAFDNDSVQLRVFHERGPVHVSPEDLSEFIVDRINASFPKKVLKHSEGS